MRTTRSLLLAVLIAAALAVGPVTPPVRAEGGPLRSGTIVGGAGLELYDPSQSEQSAVERSGCEYAADCLAWLHSGCRRPPAGHRRALTASIVDVRDFADGHTPRSLEMRAPSIPPWGLWPGVVVQFWGQDCTELAGTKLHTVGEKATSCDGYLGGDGFASCTFHIPAGAKWMTLSGYVTTAGLSWTLT